MKGSGTTMMSAPELAAVEASVTWGHPNETGVTNEQVRRLVAEIRRIDRDRQALSDGLSGWKAVAAKAEERAKRFDEFAAIVSEVSDVVDAFDPTIEGTLAERVKKAITK